MKRLLTLMLALCIGIFAFAQQKQNLKILYVGGSSDARVTLPEEAAARTKNFEEYLNEYFTTVTAINGRDYKQEMSSNYDVTIFDGNIPALSSPKMSRDAQGRMKDFFQAGCLSEDFNAPAIFIADAAENIGRTIGVKADWYCLCLDADAHHMNLNHPIFKGPFKTKLTIEDKPTPEAAFHYEYFTGKLPKDTPMWKVQTKGYESNPGFRIGMVARPWGFLDSPDAEFISSGVCAKTIDAVAIGRHGNFFFWGFAASPAYMTDEAKQVFANAVVYTAGLKGQKIIARKYDERATTKEFLKEVIYYTDKEAYEENTKRTRKFYADAKEIKKTAIAKKAKGEKLSEAEQMYIDYDFDNIKEDTFEEHLQQNMRGYYDKFGMDVEAFHKFLKENEPYMYGEPMYMFSFDEDAKSLGIANTDIKLLDKAISLWENGEDVAKAKRILNKYTLCTFEKPQEWRKWFNTYKGKLFFTQAGGWHFMVNTLDPSVPGNDYKAKALYDAGQSIKLNEPTDNEPISAGATLVVAPGGKQFVIVKINIKNGYHIYGRVSEKDPFIATEVSLTLPEGYTAGTVKKPADSFFNANGTTQYTGTILFSLPIEGAGKGTIKVNCKYQCCDSQICFPPAEKVMELPTILEVYSR